MKNIVEIEKLDHFGRGIARIDGMPVFVLNALPNEVVKIEIIKEKKNFKEAKVIEYLKLSNERVKPNCQYYDNCGGCNIMHLSYPQQLLFKENKVREVLKKFCNFDKVEKIISTNEYYYRNKITLQVKEKIGYFKEKTYELIEINKCLIADDRINRIIFTLKNIDLKFINQIVIRCTNSEIMVVFYSKNNINLDISKFVDVSTIVVITDKEYILKGKGYIEEKINNIKYVISPTSFFQVNTVGMEKLYNKVLEYCGLSGNENLLDLYCGTGTIGIYLSKYCGKVFGIEINKEAIKDAFKNKELNNLKNIDFKSGDVKDILKFNKFKPDIIVVDPPRAGLDKDVINELIDLQPQKIIYVSCDIVTLSRDLNLLKECYNIVEVTPVDMFPNTYHVECVCVLYIK